MQSGSTAVTELIPVTICFALLTPSPIIQITLHYITLTICFAMLPPSPIITNGWSPESINNLHSNAETVQFVKIVEEQNLFDNL